MCGYQVLNGDSVRETYLISGCNTGSQAISIALQAYLYIFLILFIYVGTCSLTGGRTSALVTGTSHALPLSTCAQRTVCSHLLPPCCFSPSNERRNASAAGHSRVLR